MIVILGDEQKSRATNPEYSNGANFIFNGATRALTLRPLPNGTTPDVADWANIAPFFLNETFPGVLSITATSFP